MIKRNILGTKIKPTHGMILQVSPKSFWTTNLGVTILKDPGSMQKKKHVFFIYVTPKGMSMSKNSRKMAPIPPKKSVISTILFTNLGCSCSWGNFSHFVSLKMLKDSFRLQLGFEPTPLLHRIHPIFVRPGATSNWMFFFLRAQWWRPAALGLYKFHGFAAAPKKHGGAKQKEFREVRFLIRFVWPLWFVTPPKTK